MLRQLATPSSRAAVRLAARIPRTQSASSFLRTVASSPSSLHSAAPVAAAVQSTRQPFSSSARWYSSSSSSSEADKAQGEQKQEANAAQTAEADAAAEGEPLGEPLSAADAAALRKELEAKSKEVVDWKDKYLRSVADFRNLQERTQRDIKSARDFAITHFAKDLVDSVDNLDRALAMVPATTAEATAAADAVDAAAPASAETTKLSQDVRNLVDGLKMTETVLLQTLKKHGLERFDPAGAKFDPNEHEATFMTPVPDKEHNTVFHTQQKGFRLHGRVLRAAKVGVVNNNNKK
ncbi:mitochondrial co-chaperone [Niveomyces insectorum RCEF 264]|uniref:GrpE protein homolog n=1 Tax=Niveomyces insectorum RCEF 264 TaxID=1081102 RepID=A0A162JD32_9HYPO|nr:mitochondrial co-chaperone [Niveomyces insectorum RCEF 264]